MMMMKLFKPTALLAAATTLSACASMSVFKDSNTDATLAPPPTAPAMPSSLLSATEISSLLTGKSWHWKGPKNSGITLYASDGTSLVEVIGKGTTQGKWIAKDGQLCESFAPAPFLPQGVPMTCQPFTAGAAGSYTVGQASFRIAS